jgi:hypothetical protein
MSKIETGLEQLDSNLVELLIKFVQDGILALVNQDEETVIKVLQDAYQIVDVFQNFPENIDNLILNTTIPHLVREFLPKTNKKIIESIEENV